MTSWAPDGGLEEAGDARPDRPAEYRADAADEDVQRARHPDEDVPEVERRQEADEVLALAADVEHPAAEREGDCERRQDERRRDDQRLLEVERGAEALVSLHPREEPAQPGAGEDCLVGGEGVVAGRDDDEAADEEREHRGRERP